MLARRRHDEKDRLGPGHYPEGMNQVESRPLRYFVAVAEELNFARAAERVGIAPPALSRAISGLEAELGVRLFERTTRHVVLAEPGASLLGDVRDALLALDAATNRARRRADAADSPLVLAVKADVEGGLLEDVLAVYRAEHAAVPVEIAFTGWREQAGLLRSGDADVAIVVEPFDTTSLDHEPLMSESQRLAVPAGHPFADNPRLRMADVESRYVQAGPDTHVYVPRGAQRPHFTDVTQMLRQIELGHMVALLPESLARRTTRSQLRWCQVVDAPELSFAVAWPRRSHSLATAAFVRAATAVAAERAGTPVSDGVAVPADARMQA